MSQATLSSTPYRNSNLFTDHYLKERIDELDAWQDAEGVEAAFEELRTLYEEEGRLVEGHKEDSLIDAWIDPVLEILGYGVRPEAALPDGGGHVDRLLFESDEARREAVMQAMDGDADAMFNRASAVLEAKQWESDFTERFSEERQYRDASHQVKFYLERTPEQVTWGVLTDGKKWRLYGTKDYETQTFYEVDLPELLETGDVEDFKYFYLFFRPEAFTEVAGASFLDTVWTESETAAKELGEDLQDNVFTALRVLGKGFVETNDLDIDPDDEDALDELKEQSLVLLYRLMFVLYAESRQLINPDDPDAEDEYRANFSLDQKRLDILRTIEEGETFDSAYSEFSKSIWQRLQDLFELIDEGNDALGVTAYNGGLFDTDEHAFLTEHTVSDRYLAEVIYRLSTTETDDGEFVLADYADLDTRHLGSIYEGLLEHEFRIAPEEYAAVAEDGGQVWKPASEVSDGDAVETVPEGGLYVVNDEGERKATGAYYTPDYVVTYIVEETVDPLIDDVRADLADTDLEPGTMEYVTEFWKRVKRLEILDPAMGSGHFLTKATGYVAEQVMAEVRELETATVFDEKQIRREVSKECIYGVDLNGMAVELAKLSMWLETLAADQPLAFLDHHLKTGNSLVGSDISAILSTDDGDEDDPSGQTTLSDWMEQTRRDALDHVMDLMGDLLAIENESLDDIKAMERTYDEIRDDPRFRRLLAMCSVHTAGQFGLDVPPDAEEQMARALRDDSWEDVAETDWFESAQAMADEERFFHWELEFPEVFFDEDGEVLENGGFDAVVGNPPYARIPQDLAASISGGGPTDLYAQFVLTIPDKVRDGGMFSFIVPTSWETGPAYSRVRKRLLGDGHLNTLINLPYDVFDDAYVDTGIFVWEDSTEGEECKVADRSGSRTNPATVFDDLDFSTISTEVWEELGFVATNEAWIRISSSLDDDFTTVGEITDSTRGVLVTDESLESDTDPVPILLDSFQRYEHLDPRAEADWEELGERPPDKTTFEGERVLIRRLVSRSDRLLATYAEDFFVSKKDTYVFTSGKVSETILLSVLNSKLVSWWHFNTELAASKDDFRQITLSALRELPIPDSITETELAVDSATFDSKFDSYLAGETDASNVAEAVGRWETLALAPDKFQSLRKRRSEYNTSLRDHLGNYSDGRTLAEIGFAQPPEGRADSILAETTETREKLQIERADVEREDATTVTIHLTARYKPDEEGHDLDQYGYTETEFLPALRITDLSETEADLIEAFVPVAVAEAGGFADFRDNATKTNSPMDRLEALTLPAVDDVERGLANYRETQARAEELDAKIERTDDLIDEIVYDLYGLTDEEIAIVEDAVGE